MYDVIVIGGGAAGLTGALVLARSRRSVLVVDGGQQRNGAASAVHGFLGSEGLSPGDLMDRGAAEVRRYGGEIAAGHAVSARPVPAGFEVTLAGGPPVSARRLLVSTGLTDELPDLPGLRERWGQDVIHCPYCHGWEIRDQAVGVLATTPDALEEALLLRQWTDDATVFLHTAPEPAAGQRERLAARDVRVVDGEVASLIISADRLAGVRLHNGTAVPVAALVVAPTTVPRHDVIRSLGIDPGADGLDLVTDPTGRTTVPGVWVAGNVCDVEAQVVDAASSGSRAAISINADLVLEDVDRAVTARRAAPARP
jgi:thioredoxin reductase